MGITQHYNGRPQVNDFGIPFKGFKVHPDTNPNTMTLQFSVNLLEQMKGIENSFAYLDERGIHTAPVYQGMLAMYHKFMILSVKYPDLLLVPLQYIKTAWYAHMTHPVLYQAYCKQLIAKYGNMAQFDHLYKQRYYVVPCDMMCMDDVSLALFPQAFAQTCELWQLEYKEPYTPQEFGNCTVALPTTNYNQSESEFYCQETRYVTIAFPFKYSSFSKFLEEYSSYTQKVNQYFASLGSSFDASLVNITGAMVEHDMKFFQKWRESLGVENHIYDHEYQLLVKSYERYLYFVSKNSDAAPSYLIDFVWHSHMSNPVAYIHDTVALFGQILDHDATYQPTAEQTNLLNSKWKQEFATDLEKDHTYAMK